MLENFDKFTNIGEVRIVCGGGEIII